jgi:flagellar hook assembly protein FlgD
MLIRNRTTSDYEAGAHKVIWDARNDGGESVTSGVYLAVFKAGEIQQVRRVVLMK